VYVEFGSRVSFRQWVFRRSGGGAQGRSGEFAGQFEGAFAFRGDERRDVYEGFDIGPACCA
jgi:hypothetical protein